MTEDLESRRAMKRFGDLVTLVERDPDKALKFIGEHCSDPNLPPYTDEAAAYCFVGMLQGVLLREKFDLKKSIDILRAGHEPILRWRPEDFIGRKRRFARA